MCIKTGFLCDRIGAHRFASFLVFVALMFALTPSVSRADYHGVIEKGWEDRMRQGIFYVANSEFERGLAVFDEYIKAFPQNPGGYFFYAAAVQEKIQKFNKTNEFHRFFKYAKKCKKVCRKNLEKDPDDIIAKLYLGGIHGYIGLIEVKRRNMMRAFINGVDARKALEEVVKKRPEIPDTYFGLGLLYYFASRSAQKEGGMQGWFVRKFILHGEDMRKEGIEATLKSIEENALAKDYARASLMWMRFYEGDYEKSGRMAKLMANLYPRDNSSRWVLARLALMKNDCAGAVKFLGQIDEINTTLGQTAKDYPGVTIAQKMAGQCEMIKKEEWSLAKKLNVEVEDWLNGKPVVTIEYQNEKDLLAYWKKENRRIEHAIKGKANLTADRKHN